MNFKKVVFLLILTISVCSWADSDTPSASRWFKYGGKILLENLMGISNRIHNSVDDKLTPYLTEKDLVILNQSGSGLSFVTEEDIKNNPDMGAGYQLGNNQIIAPPSFIEHSIPYGQALMHHEVFHIQDYKTLMDAGYTKLDLGGVDAAVLDPQSTVLLQSILETRAYAEEIVFAYNQMQNAVANNLPQKEKYTDAYYSLINGYDFYRPFQEAIISGLSVEEARHKVSIAILNSNQIHESYVKKAMQKESDNMFSMSIGDILMILNDGKLTEEDIMGADKFWEFVCAQEETKDSQDCQIRRVKKEEKACKEVKRKWKTCEQLAATLAGDNFGGRFFTDKSDDALYESCCKPYFARQEARKK